MDPYWAFTSELMLRGIDPLRLNAAGDGPGSPGGEQLYARDAVPLYWLEISRMLSDQLRPAGYDTVIHGWDWRMHIIDQGALLGARILAEVNPADPCAIAAHSAGGLVARAAWSWLGARQQTGLIRRIITLGTPHWGTYAPVQTWVGQGDLIAQLRWILNGLAFGFNANPVLPNRHYWSDDQIITLTQTWPSMYDLMPVIGAPGSEDDPDRADLFAAAHYAAGRRPSQAHLDYARTTFRDWIFDPASQPPTWVITSVIASGWPTPVRLDPSQSETINASALIGGAGDGTVPSSSATAPNSIAIDWAVAHSDIPRAAITAGYLRTWILDQRSPPDPPPPPEKIPGIVQAYTSLPPIVSTVAGCAGAGMGGGRSCRC